MKRAKRVVKPRVPRTHAGKTWTKARYFSFIRSALRRAWSKYPVKFQVLEKAKTIVKGKRHKYEYECSQCGGWFKQAEVEVDHIIPCGSLKEFEDLPRFVKTLFCEEDNLRVVCKPCHRIITVAERAKGEDK